MMKYFFKKNKAISFVLAAAMVLTFAAESADSALYSPLKTNAGDEFYATGTTDPPDNKVGGDILDDVFGETTFYRWEEVTNSNYPTDADEHLSLMFFGENNQIASVMTAPDCIYMGPDSDPLEGVSKKMRTDGEYSKFDGNGYIDEHDTYFLRIADKGKNNSTFHPENSAFFTSEGYGTFYTKYTGKKDGQPQYQLYLKGTNGKNYYLEPDEDDSQGMLDIETKPDNLRKWTFSVWQSKSRQGKKMNLWNLWHDDGYWGDNEHLIQKDGWLCVDDDDRADNNLARWFIGTPYYFSTIKGNVDVRENQVLYVGSDEYVDASGNAKKSNGCIIQNGTTITIEKGGVLSVSGQLINNGTIINNGGVILVRDGGTIGPFIQGSGVGLNGCGTIKCNDGDIIIQEGGALYGGMADTLCQQCPFYLDGNSTLINMGLLVYGAMKLGNYANVELYETSRTYGSMYNYKKGSSGSYFLYKRDADGSISKTQYSTASEVKNNVEKNFAPLAKYGYTMREYWLCQTLTPELQNSYGKYMAYFIWSKNTTVPQSDLPSGWNKYWLENNKSVIADYWTTEYTFLDPDIYKADQASDLIDLNGAKVKTLEHVITNYSGVYVPYDMLSVFNGSINVSKDTKVNVRKSDGSVADYSFAKTDSVFWDATYATHLYYGYNQWKYKELIL